MIPDNKEDGYIYYIFLAPRESETTVLRYRNKHLQEPLQKPNHIQLMELRAKTIRWKIRLVFTMPSFLYISKHVDISAGALRMTASLFSTRENVHWEIYYYPQ